MSSPAYKHHSMRVSLALMIAALPQLGQQLIGRNIEGILAYGSADDDRRMTSKDIGDHTAGEACEVVDADKNVIEVNRHVVYPRLVFGEAMAARTVIQCPRHMADEACPCVSLPRTSVECLLDPLDQGLLIEVSIGQIHLLPRQKLELSARNCSLDINPGFLKSCDVQRQVGRFDNVNLFLPLTQTFGEKRVHDAPL